MAGSEEDHEGVKVFFNPFAHTIEQNNEFIRLGYEPYPIQIPIPRDDVLHPPPK